MRNFARSAGQIGLAVMIAFALASSAFAQRTPLKPGMNFFSPQQDIELGQKVSQDAERQIPMLRRPQVDDYLDRLGKRLAANAPGEKFPYQFKCVNDSTINAFALPGGFLYINRGTIEAASNEAELAGVMSHEIGHVALRHGTNQASKQYLAQAPLAILGSVLGGNSAGAILAQIGTGFALNSVLLKYSRDDERQADLMAAQILFDSGYDPRYIASFLEKLGDRGGWEVMSSHPNPQNRVQNINAEIGRLGPVSSRAINDSNEFRSTQRLVKSLPAAPAAGSPQTQTSSSTSQAGRPARPSDRYQSFDAGNMKLSHPDNWTAYGEQQAFTLAPEGGIVSTADMDAVAYGAMMAVFTPGSGRRSRPSLEEATNQLIQALQSSNRAMRMAKNNGQIRVGGQTAQSMLFTNDSPMGGRETDWLVTVLRPEGLVYFVFVAPEQEFTIYQRAFGKILDSIAFYDK
jgi:Zn-dependent protease with chaperone function